MTACKRATELRSPPHHRFEAPCPLSSFNSRVLQGSVLILRRSSATSKLSKWVPAYHASQGALAKGQNARRRQSQRKQTRLDLFACLFVYPDPENKNCIHSFIHSFMDACMHPSIHRNIVLNKSSISLS
mmetsp:Transcript_21826/g.42939  ORF Transcript_21826/g.42939 Transcript_21826/m.42939 type:complete len:129 (+) Transcript_21826:526-912(+)